MREQRAAIHTVMCSIVFPKKFKVNHSNPGISPHTHLWKSDLTVLQAAGHSWLSLGTAADIGVGEGQRGCVLPPACPFISRSNCLPALYSLAFQGGALVREGVGVHTQSCHMLILYTCFIIKFTHKWLKCKDIWKVYRSSRGACDPPSNC